MIRLTLTVSPRNFQIRMDLSDTIKREALSLGFSTVGIAGADYDSVGHDRFLQWLDKGYHAGMSYLARDPRLRFDPHLHVPMARSAIVCALNYYSNPRVNPVKPYVSIYARGENYHSVVKDKLETLGQKIKSRVSNAQLKSFVDSSPLSEKSLAIRAGIGFQGKNGTVIMHPGGDNDSRPLLGSFCFLGIIITNLKLEADCGIDISCGQCRLCIDACPTGAIVGDGVIDCNMCISYHTTRNKRDIPHSISSAMNNMVFGCDICQFVCPHNKNAIPTLEPCLSPDPQLLAVDFDEFAGMSETEFRNRFEESSLGEISYSMFQRNLRIAQANTRGTKH